MKTQITVSQVLELLSSGYTRTTDNPNYNPEIGSIEDELGLTPSEIKHLFTHPKLVGRKTIKPKVYNFEIVDDVEDLEVVDATEAETVEAEEATIINEYTEPVA